MMILCFGVVLLLLLFVCLFVSFGFFETGFHSVVLKPVLTWVYNASTDRFTLIESPIYYFSESTPIIILLEELLVSFSVCWDLNFLVRTLFKTMVNCQTTVFVYMIYFVKSLMHCL